MKFHINIWFFILYGKSYIYSGNFSGEGRPGELAINSPLILNADSNEVSNVFATNQAATNRPDLHPMLAS